MSEWKKRIAERKGSRLEPSSPFKSIEDSAVFKNLDVGIKNKENNSFIKIDELGRILMFASSESGLIIEPDGEVKVVAGKLSLISKSKRESVSGEKEIVDFRERLQNEYIEKRRRNGLEN